MGAERRSSPRHDCELDIAFAIGETWSTTKTRNLSLGGVLLAWSERLAMGTRMRLKFSVPTQPEPIEVGAQVRWTDEGGFGVQFDGLRARDVWALGKFFEKL